MSEPEPARASTGRDLDRAVDRLVRLSGRLDLPDEFRDSVGNALTRVTSIRETVKGKKGAARAALLEDLPAIERELVDAGRNALPAELMAGFRRDAEHDLEPFRSRLSGGAWEKAVTVTVDRAVRAHFGLPEFHVVTET